MGDALLPGMDALTFRTILLDPPWAEHGGGKSKRGADRHYPLLPVKEILAVVRASPLWRPDPACCSLWCWATANYLGDALWLLGELGARYVTNAVWVKTRSETPLHADEIADAELAAPGLGQRFRHLHELMLFATIGKVPVPPPERRLPSVILAMRGRHSAKPQRAYSLIETHDGPGRRAEFFARDPREGWTVMGNEIQGGQQ